MPKSLTLSWLSLLLVADATAAAHTNRFSASAALRPAAAASDDGRFTLQAQLRRAEVAPSNNRFALRAELQSPAPVKAITVACNAGADALFQNSFE